jgi:hypothetical protein
LRLAELARIPPERHRDFIGILVVIYTRDISLPEKQLEGVSDEQLLAIAYVERVAEELARALGQLEPKTREFIRGLPERALSPRGLFPNLVRVIRNGDELIGRWNWARPKWSDDNDDPEYLPELEPEPKPKREPGRPPTRLGLDNLSRAERFALRVLKLVTRTGGRLTLSGGDKGTLLEFMEVLKPCLPPDWRHRLSPGNLRYLRGLLSTKQK